MLTKVRQHKNDYDKGFCIDCPYCGSDRPDHSCGNCYTEMDVETCYKHKGYCSKKCLDYVIKEIPKLQRVKKDLGIKCECPTSSCRKCLSVGCQDDNCPTHTKENKLRFKARNNSKIKVTNYKFKDAFIDETGKYRYWLFRRTSNKPKNLVNFILLNPSTADAEYDDPTVKSCKRLASSNGYYGFYITNLFAYRATNPNDLLNTADPIGLENDKYIKKYAKKCNIVVVAWGNKGTLHGRSQDLLENLKKITELYCLDINKSGEPKHPLYIKKDTKFIKYKSLEQ
jgi:hypothetical protein